MKRIWKIPFVALLAVFALVSFSINANAAEKKPYEYDFVVDTTAEYNGFKGVREMVVTFDEDLPSTFKPNEVELYQGNDKVLNVINSVTKVNNKLIVTFKNLEFLNPTDMTKQKYRIVIGKDADVVTAQVSEYNLPFDLYEILPGFKSVFIEGLMENVNNNIFKYNAPRDIAIHVPKAHLTKIETIHRYKGVAQQGNEPALTNIDVIADPGAARMKAWIGNEYITTNQNSRDLDYRADIKGFSMGQAGIDALVCVEDKVSPCDKQVNDFHLKAYDSNGKVLTKRSFKIKVNDQEKDFKINDYIKAPAKVFGTIESLYNLMANEKLLESILTQIPIDELDKLGVTYALGNTIEITNLEQLQLALANEKIKHIDLKGGVINLFVPLIVNRDVTISNGKLGGDVELRGQDITVQLKDMEITNTLTIDVGANGTVVAENVQVGANGVAGNPSVIIISGGVNSVYLFDFTSENGIVLENTTSLRIVTNGKISELTMNGTGDVTLEGQYGTVDVNETANLVIKGNTEISQVNIKDGKTLTLTKPEGMDIPTYEGTLIVINVPPVPGENTKPTISLNYNKANDNTLLTEFADMWKDGVGIEGLSALATSEVDWKVSNPNVFGGNSSVVYKKDIQTGEKLIITGASDDEIREVILRGEDVDKIYEVKIHVRVQTQ